MKKWVQFSFLFLAGFVLLWAWFKIVPFHEVLAGLKKVNGFYILLGSVFMIVPLYVRSIRLKVLLTPFIQTKTSTVFTIDMAGLFANHFLLSQFAIFLEMALWQKTQNLSASRYLPASIINKTYDVGVAFLFFPCLLFLPVKLHPELLKAALLTFCVFIIGVFFLIFLSQNDRFVTKAVSFFSSLLPAGFRHPFLSFSSICLDSVKLLRAHPRVFFVSFTLSVSAVFLEAVGILLLAAAFSFHLPYSVAVLGRCLSVPLFLIPSPPAQIGTHEWITTVVYIYGFGLPRNIMGTLALAGHALFTLIVFLLGGACFLALFYRVGNSDRR